MAIRVVLADDHYLVREGVRRLLETQPDVEVIAVCGDAGGGGRRRRTPKCPDVVVTDIRMPPTGTDEGVQIAEWLRGTTRVPASSCSASTRSPRYALAVLEHGTAGRAYLLKERVDDVEQLADAIRSRRRRRLRRSTPSSWRP